LPAFERIAIGGSIPSSLHAEPRATIDADIVLEKLACFRLGGEVSDTQWRDVLGVLESRVGRLDEPYLELWAPRLDVDDLLLRARTTAYGDDPGP
jgi:hypothetical protein